MRIAHSHGIRTNATMPVRAHRDSGKRSRPPFQTPRTPVRTGGFKAFVPLPFRRGSSGIPARSSATYDLKICALARVVLDNFSHVRTPVTHYGDRFVQVLLNFGADDIGGTHWREEVAVSAGAAPVDRDENFMRRQHGDIWKVAQTPEEAVELLYSTPVWDISIRKFAAI